MVTLIPAIGSPAFDSAGEQRFAERLQQKIDDDYASADNLTSFHQEGFDDIFFELKAPTFPKSSGYIFRRRNDI